MIRPALFCQSMASFIRVSATQWQNRRVARRGASPLCSRKLGLSRRLVLPLVLFASLVCFVGCSPNDTETELEQRVFVVPEPDAFLSVSLRGQVGNTRSESVNAPSSDLRLEWLASEGDIAAPGDVVARFDTELLELWLESNREELEILTRKRRVVKLSNQRLFHSMRTKLLETEESYKATQLAYEESKRQDEAERGILEREMNLAQEALARAEKKLVAIQSVEKQGGAAAAEVRDAMLAVDRALANIRVPQARLAEFDAEDGSEKRLRLDQKLAALELNLGDETQSKSLRGRLAEAIAKHARDLEWAELEEADLNEQADDATVVIDDAVRRTEKGGVISASRQTAEVPLVPGVRLSSRELLGVIQPEDAVIYVQVPELLRDSVRLRNRDGLPVELRIPSRGSAWLPGKLSSVSTVKMGENYVGTVRLTPWPEHVYIGAGVECRVQIPMLPAAVVIPRWWATAGFRPTVQMESGETRVIEVRPVGDSLVVIDGLSIGDRILPPTLAKESGTLLYSSVDILDRHEIRLATSRPRDWEIVEMVDDGTVVTNGQVVARLRRSLGRKTRASAAEMARLKAEAARDLSRMNARGDLSNAYLNWQEARIATEEARTELEIDRQRDDLTGEVQGVVAARLSEIERGRLEEEFKRLSNPVYDEIRSLEEKSQDALETKIAVFRDEKARLDAAKSRQAQSWTTGWDLRRSWQEAIAAELKSEQAYDRAQVKYMRDLSSADAQYEKAMISVQRLLDYANQQAVHATAAGRAYLNPGGRRPTEVGKRLWTSHLFSIPKNARRSFNLHAPARMYADFKVGQEIRFFLPSEGAKPLLGTVVHVADFFEKRALNTGKKKSSSKRGRGSFPGAEISEQVEATVRIRVEFDADSEDAAPPGTTVVIELAP